MKFYNIIFSLLSIVVFSQSKNGYWDNVRTTNETFTLKSNEKKYIKTADFPTGTTEVVFRITILDDNQKISSSLVSVLKSIPDPTGISQGSAGAVFLLSTLSGDDKTKYAVFTSIDDADYYVKTGAIKNACFVQNTAVNKDAKLLTGSSNCVTSVNKNLWFCFESDNWIMNQKILLEVVPWVDNKLSRGWNNVTKKEIINFTKKQLVYTSLKKKDEFSTAFLNEITLKYTYDQYANLLEVEKNVISDAITETCLKKTGEVNKLYNCIRDKAQMAFLKGDIQESITILQTDLIDKKRAVAVDYYLQGRNYLLSKQFDKAEKEYNAGLELDKSEISLQLEIAHLYMFTNRINESKEIHKKYKNQNVNTTSSWIKQTKDDFELFKNYKLPTANFKKILRVIE